MGEQMYAIVPEDGFDGTSEGVTTAFTCRASSLVEAVSRMIEDEEECAEMGADTFGFNTSAGFVALVLSEAGGVRRVFVQTPLIVTDVPLRPTEAA